MFDNKSILITGGTGSFGKIFVSHMVSKYKNNKIYVYSRDEMKQWEMSNEIASKKVKYIIGDVRDKEKLNKSFYNMDYVVHAAATKIVPTSESNPEECIKTNILGAMNVIDAAINNKISKVIALSTDKACNPINLYGATKLASDKLFSANSINQQHKTVFSIVRYGNVINSRGSVIPYFKKFIGKQKVPITHSDMTRFFITIQDAVNFVDQSFRHSCGGEIFVKKAKSMKIIDLARIIIPKAKFEIIGIRPGEKIHEIMISENDSDNTYEFGDHFRIIPQDSNKYNKFSQKYKNKKVKKGFVYSSKDISKSFDIEKFI